MPVHEQLREIFGPHTQTEISAHLKAHGLHEGSQSTVSAWLGGRRVPDNNQLAKIEDIYGLDRCTILVQAGYISQAARDAAPTPAGDIGEVHDLIAALRHASTKSDSRDAKLDQIIDLCETMVRTQAAAVDMVLENSARLAALVEHFDLRVVPASSAPE